MSIFDVYQNDAIIDLLDNMFDLKGFSELNREQDEDDAIECDCRVVDDEELKMIEEDN